MKRRFMNRILSLCLAALMLASVGGLGAFADDSVEVSIRQPSEGGTSVSVLTISGVEAPTEGRALSTSATVTSGEGISWEVPVLWLDETGAIAQGEATGGRYELIIAFAVPAPYIVKGDEGEDSDRFTLHFDETIAALFGTEETVSIFDEATGITFILSSRLSMAALRDKDGKLPQIPVPGLPEGMRLPDDGTYNNPVSPDSSSEGTGSWSADPEPGEDIPWPDFDEGDDEWGHGGADEENEFDAAKAVGFYCSQTAKKAMSQQELENVVQLVVTKIQPQAVNLLLEGFPAFKEAAQKNELSRNIGLYIYYGTGDNDGVDAHKNLPTEALAFVRAKYSQDDNQAIRFGLMMGMDLTSFTTEDKDGKIVMSSEPKKMADLDNTVVHEMLHAFMDDYNRVGMMGTAKPEEIFDDNVSVEQYNETERKISFPVWFKEGIASAVENVYQFRYESFNLLSYTGVGKVDSVATQQNLINAYITRSFQPDANGAATTRIYDLEYSGRSDMGTDNVESKYVTGYLATLYLGEMAAKHMGLGGAVSVDKNNNMTDFSTQKIRTGLNDILVRLHDGDTLDEIISMISDGRYQTTDQFEKEFIKGIFTPDAPGSETGTYNGDGASQNFVVDYLNYMRHVASKQTTQIPNGSILFDIGKDFSSPIDRDLTTVANYPIYIFGNSSDYIVSSVDPAKTLLNGGKSFTLAPEADGKADVIPLFKDLTQTAAKEAEVLPEEFLPVEEFTDILLPAEAEIVDFELEEITDFAAEEELFAPEEPVEEFCFADFEEAA